LTFCREWKAAHDERRGVSGFDVEGLGVDVAFTLTDGVGLALTEKA